MIINPVHNAVITPPPPPPPPQNSERRALAAAKLLTLCALTLLVGCGGGGGSSGKPTPPTPVTPFPRTSPEVIIPPDDDGYVTRRGEFEAADEYATADNHLSLIKASAAYARGATGAGETVVVVDSGIDTSHRELSGKVTITNTQDLCSAREVAAGDCAGPRHGTAVASLVAGRRGTSSSGTDMHGVAFDAQIKFIPIRLRGPDPNQPPLRELNAYSWPADDSILDNSVDYRQYIAQGEILNYSFGVPWSLAEWRRLGSGCESTGSETGPYACYKYYYRATANALAQTSKDPADRSIVVIAAGNSNGDRHDLHNGRDGLGPLIDASSPDADGALAVAFNAPGDPGLAHVITVVAIGADGEIASYSNRCGLAKSSCVAAPGGDDVRILAAEAGSTSGYIHARGTSFAAPIVSGSLAVLRQFFRRQVGNTELVNRLLATANRNGIYADSDTYGHGLVDLDKATAPVGMVMTGLSSDPNRQPLAGIRFALSGDAFGTAMQAQLAEVEFAAFDELDAPFFLSADTWVSQAARDDAGKREQHDMTLTPVSSFNGGDMHRGTILSLGFDGDEVEDARLSFAHGWWLSYGDQAGRALGLYGHAPLRLDGGEVMMNHFSDSLAFASPYLSLVRDGPGVGWSRADGGRFGFALMQGSPLFDGYQKPGGERGLGAVLDMQLSRGLWLQAGAVREREGFLGARLQGALGQAQGTTGFFGINGAWVLGDAGVNDGIGDDMRANKPWRLLASAYLGRTRPQVNGGLVQEVDRLTSSAFSIGAVRESLWRRDDWFGLRLSQPLRTERGNLKMRLPAGRTRYGELVTNDHTLNLAPAGRHLQVEAVYHVPLAGGALQATLGAERHPQHNRSSDIYPTFRVKFERRF
ncbi:S8 family serine peptidase [Candidatus Spongiihabitans sp.]|uniref:S8 family peptidase n=1 Tax=Candidatus Spongiihabitans sp. TaxID=3101308 RepID=UPI003C7CEDFF